MTQESQSDGTDSGIDRRTVLKSAAAASAAGFVGVPAFSGSAVAESDLEFRIEQGGEEKGCITPLTYSEGGDMVPIEEFYNYCESPPCENKENDGGANTPTDIEQEGYSLLFFYKDSDGVSLVMIHDEGDDDFDTNNEFKQVTFDFDGLPTNDSWVVQEDRETSEEGGTDVYRDDGSGEWSVEWNWKDKWSDGGAFGYLDDNCGSLEITIDPDFSGWPETDIIGPFKGWKALSGPDSSNPGEVSLESDKSITITCGCCEQCDSGDELLEKWEFVEPDNGECHFEREEDKGDDPSIGDVVSYENKEDDGEEEECEPVSVTFETDYCSGQLDAVVKAGSETITQTDLEVSDGEVTVTNGDSKYAISNIRFYCEAPDDTSVGESDESEEEDGETEDDGEGDHDKGHGNDEDGHDEDNPGKGDSEGEGNEDQSDNSDNGGGNDDASGSDNSDNGNGGGGGGGGGGGNGGGRGR